MQLVVYLNAAIEMLKKKENDKGLDREVIPAGILYYHIDDPLIEEGEIRAGDDIDEKIAAKLKMQGLVNSDGNVISLMDEEMTDSSKVIPVRYDKNGGFARGSSVATREQFDIMSEYVTEKIASMGREIMDGKIDINPKSDSNMQPDSCTYCNYSNICGFRHAYADENDDVTDDVSKCSNDEVFLKMKESRNDGVHR